MTGWFGHRRRRIARLQRLLDTRIAVTIRGADVLGPMTLETFALICRFGGYDQGDDILCLGRSDLQDLQVRVWPELLPPVSEYSSLTDD
jgi:hypothetical protein